MAIAANTQSGGLNQGTVSPPPPGVEVEAPEGAKAVAAKAKAGKAATLPAKAKAGKAATLPVKAATVTPPANLPPGAEWEAPEGVKAAKVTTAKTTAVKGAATQTATTKAAAIKGTTAKAAPATIAATTKATTGKTLAAGSLVTSKGVLASSPSGVAIKGITTGSSFLSSALPGLGFSLGGMAPLLVAGATAALGIGIYSYMKNKKGIANELDDAIS
ncbi:MAG: hypothetical protein HQL74_03910 [Magnetococcales bacterium]|nr:hypothetical protein [Magnetococcales bacterium]